MMYFLQEGSSEGTKAFTLNATNWTPSVQKPEYVGDISHSNHYEV